MISTKHAPVFDQVRLHDGFGLKTNIHLVFVVYQYKTCNHTSRSMGNNMTIEIKGMICTKMSTTNLKLLGKFLLEVGNNSFVKILFDLIHDR